MGRVDQFWSHSSLASGRSGVSQNSVFSHFRRFWSVCWVGSLYANVSGWTVLVVSVGSGRHAVLRAGGLVGFDRVWTVLIGILGSWRSVWVVSLCKELLGRAAPGQAAYSPPSPDHPRQLRTSGERTSLLSLRLEVEVKETVSTHIQLQRQSYY